MKKIYQQLITAVVLSITCSLGLTQNISVLVPAAPGGGLDHMSRALVTSLNAQGISATLEQIGTCRGAMAWIKNNPNKPVLMPMMVEEEVYRLKNPTADDACNIELRKERVVTTTIMATFKVCSMKTKAQADQTLKQFLSGNHRVGVTYFVATNAMVAESLLKSLNVNARVVRLQGNPRLIQALVSGDVDFIINTNSAAVVQAGGYCFVTTADKITADRLNMVSLQSISPNNAWINAGQLYFIMGDNIDQKTIRPVIQQIVKENENFKRLFIDGTKNLVDLPLDAQLEEINKHIKRF
jgi:hypothetical protein